MFSDILQSFEIDHLLFIGDECSVSPIQRFKLFIVSTKYTQNTVFHWSKFIKAAKSHDMYIKFEVLHIQIIKKNHAIFTR